MDLIFFHANCTDGWTAAYVASKRYPEAKLIPIGYAENPPYGEVEDKDVIVVDFSWPREVSIRLSLLAKSFHIYDHHKTTGENLQGLDFVTFDNARSGAGLAWDYLFGVDSQWKRLGSIDSVDPTQTKAPFSARPWFVDYVEDNDLWKFTKTDSKEIGLFLQTLPKVAEVWDRLALTDLKKAAQAGTALKLGIDYYVNEQLRNVRPGKIDNYTVGLINAPGTHASDLGAKIAETYDMAIMYSEHADGFVYFGLRSRGDIDVSAIAKRYPNGGGHKNSAGFELQYEYARLVIDSILGTGVKSPYDAS
jgi:oligoribonuclease NrnB/cAMP/cGMP phosphodiesterase (DHH superfamily)